MNIKALHPPRPDVSDWTEVASLQQRLAETVERINAMAGDVGMAKQIREFSGDLRKRCLAIAATPFLKAGSSAAAADTEARSSEPYGAALKQLAKELTQAETTIAEFEALKLQWESCRSLLSMQRETMKSL